MALSGGGSSSEVQCSGDWWEEHDSMKIMKILLLFLFLLNSLSWAGETDTELEIELETLQSLSSSGSPLQGKVEGPTHLASWIWDQYEDKDLWRSANLEQHIPLHNGQQYQRHGGEKPHGLDPVMSSQG